MIPDGIFQDLPALKRLRLDQNPIDCDCGIHTLRHYFTNNNLAAMVNLKCISPPEIFNKTFEQLRESDFHCRKYSVWNPPSSNWEFMLESRSIPASWLGQLILLSQPWKMVL